jgi:hypothetical protein
MSSFAVSVLVFVALAGSALAGGGGGVIPVSDQLIQISGYNGTACAGRRLFFGYFNFTCSSDNATRYLCQGGAVTDWTCASGCYNVSSLCTAIGGPAPACDTAPPAIAPSCAYQLGTPTGIISVYTYLGSGAACVRQSLVSINVGPFLVDPTNTYRWQCETGQVNFYACFNASGGIGCLPIEDSIAQPIDYQNCTVFQGSQQTGNSTIFSCANPFTNVTAQPIVPKLDYDFFGSAGCAANVVLAQQNQTGFCDIFTGMNIYGQCENRSGTITLATYVCPNGCTTPGNLSACLDFTGSARGIVDGQCITFGPAQSAIFTCNGPIVLPTPMSSTSVTITSTTATSFSSTSRTSMTSTAISVPSATPVTSSSPSGPSAVSTSSAPAGTSSRLATSATVSTSRSTATPTRSTPTRDAGHLTVFTVALAAAALAAIL